MAKDKKKKKKEKKEKKAAKAPGLGSKLDALTRNPVVAEIVSAALVATASALRDSRAARRLANEAGDELGKLAKDGAEAGNALWDMALQIGRRSLEALAEEPPKRAKPKAAVKRASARSKSAK